MPFLVAASRPIGGIVVFVFGVVDHDRRLNARLAQRAELVSLARTAGLREMADLDAEVSRRRVSRSRSSPGGSRR